MRKTERDDWFWTTSRWKGYIYDGAFLVDMARKDELQYGMSLRIPLIMKREEAIEQAPVIFDEIDVVRTGTELLGLVEGHLRRITDEKMFAERWPQGLAPYVDLHPKRLQLLARRLVALGTSYPGEMAAVSLMAYALLGLAEDQEIANPAKDHECGWCYRTALPANKYCEIHHISREDRIERTKKRGSGDNLDVARRHARRIAQIATGLRRNQQGIYRRLEQQFMGWTGGLNMLPPRLERIADDEFATGARIGTNGAEWFIYLWKVLPRMQKALGADWPELVRSALEEKDWSRVLQRLWKIDPYLQATAAYRWVMTLIAAERWAEAEEIERQQRRRGRPCKNDPDPNVGYALMQVRDGKLIAAVAEAIEVPLSTLYRWKARIQPSTTSAMVSENR